jgi:hypothetical protein
VLLVGTVESSVFSAPICTETASTVNEKSTIGTFP